MKSPPPVLPPAQATSPITMDQVRAFAIASGDSNSIHLSSEAAQAAGLSGPVLHGMIIAGRLESYLQQITGYEITQFQVRFVRPAPVGSALTMSLRHIGSLEEEIHLRLIANIENDVLVAIGEARMRRRISRPGQIDRL